MNDYFTSMLLPYTIQRNLLYIFKTGLSQTTEYDLFDKISGVHKQKFRCTSIYLVSVLNFTCETNMKIKNYVSNSTHDRASLLQ